MIRKVQKKKPKISSPRKLLKVRRVRKKSSVLAKSSSLLHVRRASKVNPSIAYYSMGGVALLGILSLAGYQWIKLRITPQPAFARGEVFNSDDSLASDFRIAEKMSLSARMDYWSHYLQENFDGRDKLIALSSGVQIPDFAPIVPKNYDCTTFVETVAALSRSQAQDQFIQNIIEIRYLEGKPDFKNRNHFPEADWLPNNIHSGILSDITTEIASRSKIQTQVESKMIQRQKWLKAQLKKKGMNRAIASYVDQIHQHSVEARVPYIEISQLNKIQNQIPSGTILNFVHKNDQKHPVLISHQGIVIRTKNHVLLRHSSVQGKIRTVLLSSYIETLMSRRDHQAASWPVIGVNLNQVNDSISASILRKDSM